MKRLAGLTVTLVLPFWLAANAALAQMPPGIGGSVGTNGASIGTPRNHHIPDNDNTNPSSAAPSCPGQVEPPEDAAEHLGSLQAALKATPEQVTLLNRYSELTQRAIDDTRRWRNRDHRPDKKLTAPALSTSLLDELRDRLTALEDVEIAGRNLYNVLTPQQRQVADLHMPAIISALAGNPVLQFN